MTLQASKLSVGVGILVLCFAISRPVRAQETGAVLAGTITGPSGSAVPNAKISVKNVATGQSTETQSNSSGIYSLPNLAPGDYEVSVSAEGFATQVAKVTLAAGAKSDADLALSSRQYQRSSDLRWGIWASLRSRPRETPQDQARLDRRSHMLKIHQRLGLITTGPLVATIVTSSMAGGRHSTATGRDCMEAWAR